MSRNFTEKGKEESSDLYESSNQDNINKVLLVMAYIFIIHMLALAGIASIIYYNNL